MHEAQLVRRIQRAIRKKSAWEEHFTASELAARIEALSGAGLRVSDLISLLNRCGAFPRGTGPFPCWRKTADLNRTKTEMVLAAGRGGSGFSPFA